MRWGPVAAGMLLAVAGSIAGCGRAEDKADAKAADYTPPTVTSRLDFGGMIERRFRRLDTNADGKLQRSELSERAAQSLSRADADGDGALSSDEYSRMMLERFDRLDLNRDGTVTSEERQTWRDQRQAAQTKAPPQDQAKGGVGTLAR